MNTIYDPNPSPLNYTWKYGKDEDVIFVFTTNSSSGWITTNITFDMELLETVNKNTTCYGYWISLVDDTTGQILAADCMRAFPMWMNNMKVHIGNMRFRDLFIPGTHDSGAALNNSNIEDISLLKYLITQDETIKSQLYHGIRYLDIRIGYYGHLVPKFWVNHAIQRIQPLDYVLKQVREFVKDTNEIVIFDVQEFPVGFGDNLQIHEELVKYLEDHLTDVLVTNLVWSATLNEIWATGKNVIVGYDLNKVVEKHPVTMSVSVQHKWGDVLNLPDLRKHLEWVAHLMALNETSRPISAMAELTPDFWGIIMDLYQGLRVMTDKVNADVSRWYQNEWANITNVVSVDFYRGTNIIKTAINSNF